MRRGDPWLSAALHQWDRMCDEVEGEGEELAPYPDMVRCKEHGPGGWCFVQSDGTHIGWFACRCLDLYSVTCPIDVHRAKAER